MIELLITAAIIGYIIYLRYYADLRSEAERDTEKLQVGIRLYDKGELQDAQAFFTQYIQKEPASTIAYLYLARCQRLLGHPATALETLKKGESYDNTVADLHLEMGQILYEQEQYDEAFQGFDRAIFHSKGQQADAYEWRGLTRQRLNQPAEAQQDLEHARRLRETAATASPVPAASPFVDRAFVRHAVLVLVNSLILLVVIKKTTVIHPPYLLATIAATLIGFVEPQKGWVLAILQAITLWVGYTFFTTAPQASGDRDLEAFGLYGSMILTFVGSFIGGVLKRQLIHP